MNAFWQILLVLLAAVGLLAVGWLIFGTLVTPVAGSGGPVYAVVPASGDGEHLEQDVKGLLWLRGGLSATGRRVAAALLTGSRGVVLCPLEQLETYLRA